MAVWSAVDFSAIKQNWRYDAEYWHAVHIENERIIARAAERYQVKQIYDLVKRVTGSAFYPSFAGYYGDSGMPFIRVADLGDFFLNEEKMVRVDPAIIAQHRQISTVGEGGIVIAKGGSIGGVCIVQAGMGECAVCRDVIALETDPKRVDSFYLVAFLGSRFGQLQLERYKSQQVQAHLTFEAVGNVKVVVPSREYQASVSRLIQSALAELERSKALYAQAEAQLSAELGLDAIDLSNGLTYQASFSNIPTTGRWDAEFYQPKYERLLECVGEHQPVPLGELCTLMKGIEVGSDAYVDEGRLFLRVSTLTPQGVSPGPSEKYIKPELFEELASKYQPQHGEILLTKDGTPGVAHHVDQEVQAIISGGIVRLQVRDGIHPEYLALAIHSRACQLLIERDLSGALIKHWKLGQIRRLPIPRLGVQRESELAQFVVESKQCQREAESLLQQAKRRVEELIAQEARS